MPSATDGATVEVLLPEEQLQKRVKEMGAEIRRAYAGRPLVLVGILKGSFVFMADLARAIDLPLEVEFMGISSYQGTRSTGVVQITADLSRSVEGMDVLLVEDIVDTGLTMSYLLDNLQTRHPASLRVATLLEKPARLKVPVKVDWKGFTIGDEFVVGYGLDWDGRYRNLPFIGVVRG
jgi:hypoxanthine phosphoribosyltransferase